MAEAKKDIRAVRQDSDYGFQVRGSRKKKKVTTAVALFSAFTLLAVAAVLTPLAREYGWKEFVLEPMYLLRYVLRPFAMALLGWAAVETVRELSGIRIWEQKSERTRRTVRIVFYMLAVCMAVTALLTLWLGVEMAYQWYLPGKMMREQGFFNSSTAPHLMPERLVSGILYFYAIYLDGIGMFGGCCFVLGAALSFLRIEKEV